MLLLEPDGQIILLSAFLMKNEVATRWAGAGHSEKGAEGVRKQQLLCEVLAHLEEVVSDLEPASRLLYSLAIRAWERGELRMR